MSDDMNQELELILTEAVAADERWAEMQQELTQLEISSQFDAKQPATDKDRSDGFAIELAQCAWGNATVTNHRHGNRGVRDVSVKRRKIGTSDGDSGRNGEGRVGRKRAVDARDSGMFGDGTLSEMYTRILIIGETVFLLKRILGF
ncbi:unnamed protein product [Haemonchus placei]|uniref:Reverse transcriptase n=1 Tax=Haemonchus placei TaxID=6290 RepID=A0A0N4X3S5_HAEPC|nr:unnamed protein product [Haemonchus placei]